MSNIIATHFIHSSMKVGNDRKNNKSFKRLISFKKSTSEFLVAFRPFLVAQNNLHSADLSPSPYIL